MEEKEFFRYEDVAVTNSRFIVASQTFAMSNITSVKVFTDAPSRIGPIVCGAIGILALAGAPAFGLLLLAGAVAWWFWQKTYYHVALTTAGGETKALTSTQRNYIEKVVRALNDAIVHRG